MISSPSSYFTEAEAGDNPRYQVVIYLGSYQVPLDHIHDRGNLVAERSPDLGSLIAPSFKFILDNSSGIYSYDKDDFIFNDYDSSGMPSGEWFHRHVSLYLAYYRPYSDEINEADMVLLYRGWINSWRCHQDKSPQSNSPLGPPLAEIGSIGTLSLLSERLLGRPSSAGVLSPLIYGSVIKEGVDLRDDILWTPDEHWTASGGDTSECDDVVTEGSGTFAASDEQKYSDSYSFKAVITAGGATDEAYAWAYCSGAAVTTVIASVWLKLTSIPGTFVNRIPFLLGFRNSGGTDVVNIAATTTGQIQLYVYGLAELVNCDLNVNDILNTWAKLSLGLDLSVPGTVRLYLNGDVVGQADSNYAFVVDRAFFGFKKAAANATAWIGYYDDFKLDEPYYPLGYYLPGYPFTSIDNVYRDGVIIPKRLPKYYYNRDRAGFQQPWVKAVYGRYVSDELYAENASYGLAAFSDISDPPGGTVLIGATKNTTTHPVDQVAAIITEVGLDEFMNDASFTAAKAANSGDVVGSYFEDVEAGSCIGEICRKCLYGLYEDIGQIFMEAYSGEPPDNDSTVDMSLTDEDYFSRSVEMERGSVYSIISSRYGWYKRDNTLFDQVIDTEVQEMIGDVELESNFEYSEQVSSGDATMVADKLDKQIKRFRRPYQSLKLSGKMNLARICLGDTAAITDSSHFDAEKVFCVYGKSINFSSGIVDLNLVRFIGEELGDSTIS